MNNKTLKQFNIISHNICGLNSSLRRADLSMFLSEAQPAVVVLQEPKMDPTAPAPPMKNYNAIHFGHPTKRTGIIFYIHQSVSYHVMSHIPHATPYHPDKSSTVVGFVWVSSPLLPCPIVVGGAYLSHGAEESDVRSLAMSFAAASSPLPSSPPHSQPLPVFLLGDLNSRHPRWDPEIPSHPAPQSLNKWVHQHLLACQPKLTIINNMFTESRKQYTHINTSHYVESVLDLAITSHPNMVAGMKVLHETYTSSDHFPIVVNIRTANHAQGGDAADAGRKKWRTDASEEKWAEFTQHLQQSLQTWTDTYKCQNQPTVRIHLTQQQVDDCWQELVSIITTAAEATIGTKTIPHNSKEWFHRDASIPGLLDKERKARSRFNTMRKRNKRFPDSISTSILLAQARSAFRRASQARRKAIRTCRAQTLEELAGSLDDGRHKLLWGTWKRIAATPRIPLGSFTKDKAPPMSPQQALDNLAAHLANISSQPPTSESATPECIMQEEHVHGHMAQVPTASDLSAHPHFSLQDVAHLCSTSRLTTALGSDNISPHFLRRGGDVLHRAIFLLLSICSRHGLMPSSFRHALVVTLFKGDGDVNDANNYRPISITSIVARMYERLHMKQLLHHMQAAGIPSAAQFGFTKHRSTHDAAYRLLSTVIDTMNTGVGDFVPTVFIDISKAYDKVWIEGLLYKIHHDCNITGPLYYVLRALLIGRTMQVVHDNMTSNTHTLTAGVPQGSVLAPLLFLIYIHSLTNSLSSSICQSLFADDIALLPLTSGTAGLICLQTALNITTTYAQRWKITFSQKKTQVLFFRPNTSRQSPTPPHHLSLTSFTLSTTRTYTYLGVVLDDRLTFMPHLTQLVRRTTTMSMRITRMVRRDLLPSFPVIHRLVQCVLIPQMVYAFAFLCGSIHNKRVTDTQTEHTNKTQSNIYTQLKNNILRPLRASLQLPFHVHHNSLFIESRLLNIDNMLIHATARLIHRWMNMSQDVNNAASTLFQQHITQYHTLPSFHPCVRMCATIDTNAVPLLNFSPTNHDQFKAMSRSQLHDRIWQHQYESWLYAHEHTTRPNSLPVHYSQLPVPRKELPRYLTTETPAAAARRARLRFRRSKFKFNLERVGYHVSTTCSHCDNTQEDNHHVLCECPAHDGPRDACRLALTRLFLPCQPNPLLPISIDTLISPDIACARAGYPSRAPQALFITTTFFRQIAATRAF
jgi:exonuclease III